MTTTLTATPAGSKIVESPRPHGAMRGYLDKLPGGHKGGQKVRAREATAGIRLSSMDETAKEEYVV